MRGSSWAAQSVGTVSDPIRDEDSTADRRPRRGLEAQHCCVRVPQPRPRVHADRCLAKPVKGRAAAALREDGMVLLPHVPPRAKASHGGDDPVIPRHQLRVAGRSEALAKLCERLRQHERHHQHVGLGRVRLRHCTKSFQQLLLGHKMVVVIVGGDVIVQRGACELGRQRVHVDGHPLRNRAHALHCRARNTKG